VNEDSKSSNERVLSWLLRWACRAATRDFCSALSALVGPVKNIFFLTVHFFSSFAPIAQKLGRQPCWVACLLVCVSLVTFHKCFCHKNKPSAYYLNKNKDKWVEVYVCWNDVLKILEALTVPFGGCECSLTFFEDFVRLLAGRLLGEDPALLADLGIDFHRTKSCNIANATLRKVSIILDEEDRLMLANS
jgi:hypothetical protein